MKTNFAKQVLPVAVFALAIAGAFTTRAMNNHSKAVDPIQGYLRLNPQGTTCTEQDDACTTDNTGTVCTVDYDPTGAQLYGKNLAGNCVQTIFKP